MRITEPIDLYVLRILSDGNNYNPIVVWWRVYTDFRDINPDEENDLPWSTDYVGQRLTYLRNQELLEHLEPTDRSGLYRITELGRAALEHVEETGDSEFKFSDLLERVGEN